MKVTRDNCNMVVISQKGELEAMQLQVRVEHHCWGFPLVLQSSCVLLLNLQLSAPIGNDMFFVNLGD